MGLLVKRGFWFGLKQNKSRLTTFFLSLNNSLMPIAVMVGIYLAVDAMIYVTDSPLVGNRFLPPGLVITIILVLAIFLGLSVVGYWGSTLENERVLLSYFVIASVLTLGLTI